MPQLTPIAHIRTPFPDKFAVPRQAGLAPSATGQILLPPELRDAVKGLEGASHVWLLFLFDRVPEGKWRPQVRPPRLGGNRRLGVFATRSPFRPNPIGLSCVRLLEVRQLDDGVVLVLGGVDLVDGTPIVDIKPYVPYADCHPEATLAWVDGPPAAVVVRFDPEPDAWLAVRPDLRALIEETLALDPRPATHRGRPPRAHYGARLRDVDVRWRVEGDDFVVQSITEVHATPDAEGGDPR